MARMHFTARLPVNLALAVTFAMLSGCPLWNRFSRDVGLESWQVEYRPPLREAPPDWVQQAETNVGAAAEPPVEAAITDEEVAQTEADGDASGATAAADGNTNRPGDIQTAEAAPERVLAFDGERLPVLSSRTLESGLIVDVLRTGEGPACRSDSWVVLRTRGEILAGTVFDAADDGTHGPWPISQLITGLQQGVIGMAVGGVRRITIPPELAYGETGILQPAARTNDQPLDGSSEGENPVSKHLIPPGATLVYTVELVDVYLTAGEARGAKSSAVEMGAPEGSE